MEEQRTQPPRHASSHAYPLDVCPEDEISLSDLWRFLVRQWKVIGAITGLSVLGAVAYVLLATPIYEAQAVVKPPENKYVEVLNIPGISQISSADIFVKFTGNLKSSSLRQQFVEENPQFSSLRGNVPDIREGRKNESGLFFLSLQGHEAKLLVDWVNAFVPWAEKRTIGDFFDSVEVKIANQKKEIEKQLQIGRDFASQRRLDRIALLENQIAIARASKIFDRQIYGYSVAKESQKFGVTVDTLQGPMYMRGVKELTAEKEELEKRKDDEPFIAGFRDKQESLAQLDAGLEQLHAARASVHAVTVDQPAIQGKSPVKPRRMRVLAVSLVLGGIIGILVAFVVNFAQLQKAKN
jgi:chain length determinant protein (polysaccharide antigen chain regulator)